MSVRTIGTKSMLSLVTITCFACDARASEASASNATVVPAEITGEDYTIQVSLNIDDESANTVAITIVPKSPLVLKTTTPLAIALECTEGCTVEKPKLDAEDIVDAKTSAKTVRSPLKVRRGRHRLDGELSFFLCTDEICRRQTDDLTYAFDVN